MDNMGMQMSPALAGAVESWTRNGWRVEVYGPGQVVMVTGRRPNHILHLLLSVVTLGLWLVVWAVVAMAGGEQRTVLTARPDGSVASSLPLLGPAGGRGSSWGEGRGLPVERR